MPTDIRTQIEGAISKLEVELQTPTDIWPSHIEEVIRQLKDVLALIDAQPSKEKELVEALRRLRNEVGGMLGTIELELREAMGNTNLAVLKQRYAEANAALALPSPPKE